MREDTCGAKPWGGGGKARSPLVQAVGGNLVGKNTGEGKARGGGQFTGRKCCGQSPKGASPRGKESC
jgi:hypothetical protein